MWNCTSRVFSMLTAKAKKAKKEDLNAIIGSGRRKERLSA
jgi:hypothetical protein